MSVWNNASAISASASSGFIVSIARSPMTGSGSAP